MRNVKVVEKEYFTKMRQVIMDGHNVENLNTENVIALMVLLGGVVSVIKCIDIPNILDKE